MIDRLIFNVADIFYISTDCFFTKSGIEAMTWAILVISIALCIMFFRPSKSEYGLIEGTSYVVFAVLFLILNLLEFIMFVAAEDFSSFWFIDNNEVGWFWTIVNHILVLLVAGNQLLCLLWLRRLAKNARLNRQFKSYALGLIVFIIGIIGMLYMLLIALMVAVTLLLFVVIGFVVFGFLSESNDSKKESDTRYCKHCRHYRGAGNVCEEGYRVEQEYEQAGSCKWWS